MKLKSSPSNTFTDIAKNLLSDWVLSESRMVPVSKYLPVPNMTDNTRHGLSNPCTGVKADGNMVLNIRYSYVNKAFIKFVEDDYILVHDIIGWCYSHPNYEKLGYKMVTGAGSVVSAYQVFGEPQPKIEEQSVPVFGGFLNALDFTPVCNNSKHQISEICICVDKNKTTHFGHYDFMGKRWVYLFQEFMLEFDTEIILWKYIDTKEQMCRLTNSEYELKVQDALNGIVPFFVNPKNKPLSNNDKPVHKRDSIHETPSLTQLKEVQNTSDMRFVSDGRMMVAGNTELDISQIKPIAIAFAKWFKQESYFLSKTQMNELIEDMFTHWYQNVYKPENKPVIKEKKTLYQRLKNHFNNDFYIDFLIPMIKIFILLFLFLAFAFLLRQLK